MTPTILDIAGGDTLKITGRGFPDEIEDIVVELSDDTVCEIIELTATTIDCVMNPISAEGTYDVEVKAFGETRIPGQVTVVTPFEAHDVNPKVDIDIAGGD